MRPPMPIYRLKRNAKLLARDERIPLHEAQDRIAREHGFDTWSMLSSRLTVKVPRSALLPKLVDGDMLVLGARPGHGKTSLGLRLLLDAVLEGRRAVFFTLEYTELEVMRRIRSLDDRVPTAALEIVTAVEISADFIVQHMAGAPRGTVVVIDYLQILDQQRTKPLLAEQMRMLQTFARTTGVILCFISQIDRSFDPERHPLPSISDVRLPNAIPPGIFSKACFLHAGKYTIEQVV